MLARAFYRGQIKKLRRLLDDLRLIGAGKPAQKENGEFIGKNNVAVPFWVRQLSYHERLKWN